MEKRTEFIRVLKDRNFSVINNEFLRRDDLSWKAKGILAYVLTLPDDWTIHLNEVMTHSTDGEASFRSGWKELTDAGYVERKRVYNHETKKISHWETIVREKPVKSTFDQDSENLDVGNLDVGNLDVGNLDVENQALLNTNNTKYLYIPNTDKTNMSSSLDPDPGSDEKTEKKEELPYKEIVDYLNEKTGKNYRATTKKTRSLIKARWGEDFRLEDFQKVIDNKVADWKGDPRMDTYLRPETLFGTKFESYLNQRPTKQVMDDNFDFWEGVPESERTKSEEAVSDDNIVYPF